MRIVTLSSLIMLLIVLFPFFYKAEEVKCISQYGACSANLKIKFESLKGKPVKQIDFLVKELLSKEKNVEKYNLTYTPLASFTVDIVEKKAEVVVKETNSQNYFLLTATGELLSEVEDSSLPKIFISNSDVKFSDPEVKFATELLVEVYKYYSIDSFIVDESSIVGIYDKKIKLTFPRSGDIDVLLGSLELLLFQLKDKLQQSKIEDVQDFDIREIDLRYRNPVVR